MKKPPLHLYLTEVFRSSYERLASLYFRRTYKSTVPGNGRPILVIPGIVTSDRSTEPLRRFLQKQGYTAYPWGLGTNLGEFDIHLPALEQKIIELEQKHNNKITLLGWSLGGIYARELGKRVPDHLDEVITMGSPFAGIQSPNRAKWLFDLVQKFRNKPKPSRQFFASISDPAPVKTTAIYTRQDGIVPWEACMEPNCSDTHQNIEVRGSHTGLGYNKEVYKVLDSILSNR